VPINSLSVGRDVVLDIIDPSNGGILAWASITAFQSRQQTKRLQSIGLDGTNHFAEIPQGWEIAFSLDRSSAAVDAYFAQVEDGYFTGLNYLGVLVTETISEVDGSTSQYRYENLALKLSDAGVKSGDNLVKMRIEGIASRRRKVS
jgi:hypothetical protein